MEKADSALRKPVYEVKTERRTAWNQPEEYVPQGYVIPKQFENIGNSKNDSSFIAVVHIDGNAMGKRVEAIRRKTSIRHGVSTKRS